VVSCGVLWFSDIPCARVFSLLKFVHYCQEEEELQIDRGSVRVRTPPRRSFRARSMV